MALRLLLGAAARRAGANQQLIPAVCALSASQPLQQECLQAAAAAAGSSSTSSTWPAQQQLASAAFHSSAGAASSSQALANILAKEIKHEKTVYETDELVARGPPAPFVLSSAPGDTAVSLKRSYGSESVSVDASVNMQDSLALPLDEGEGDEEEEGLDDTNDVSFNVTVTKAGTSLVFECVSDGTYVDIRHVSLEPAGGLDSETAFTGPVFAELDAELQGGFRDYLAVRRHDSGRAAGGRGGGAGRACSLLQRRAPAQPCQARIARAAPLDARCCFSAVPSPCWLQERGINEDLGEFLRHLMYDKEQTEYTAWLEGVRSFVSSS